MTRDSLATNKEQANNMTKLFSAIAISFMAIASYAQSLAVSAKLDFDSYIRYEDMILTVEISNHGGSAYVVDNHGAHRSNMATIDIKKGQEFIELEDSKAFPFSHILVMPGESRSFKVDLTKYYDLSEEGRYVIQVKLVRADEVIGSRPIMVDVVNGVEITSLTRPFPAYDNMFRKYQLLYWGRARAETLFLRVIDLPGNTCSYIVNLGPVLRVRKPEMRYDREGIVTVVYQVGRDQYARTRIKSERGSVKVLGTDQLYSFTFDDLSSSAASAEGSVNEVLDLGGGPVRARKPGADAKPAKTDAKSAQKRPMSVLEMEEEYAKAAGVKLKDYKPVEMRRDAR